MSGASIEETLALWSAELREVKAQLQPLFGHASVAASASAFLDGLLGPERRKTGCMGRVRRLIRRWSCSTRLLSHRPRRWRVKRQSSPPRFIARSAPR